MTLRLALRSLATRPVRSAVLASGFGFGIAVMASLLGVGEVVLEQARSPWLAGGGDVRITGAAGRVPGARFVIARVLGAPPLRERVRAVSPTATSMLWLVRDDATVPVRATGGIPSLERAIGDPETGPVAAWTDAAGDAAWAAPDPGDVLRSLDRFHPIPDAPAWAGSWLEWLYFNGRAGDVRFYLSFNFGQDGARAGAGHSRTRPAEVTLQLDRGGRTVDYVAKADVDAASLLRGAPDVEVAGNRVRLEGTRYRITLDLERAGGGSAARRVAGEIVLDAADAPALTPIVAHGARGWVSGYVVPVASAPLAGTLRVGDEVLSLDGGRGYHDHNWGFWRDVSWRWGEVSHEDVSIVFGRVQPPPSAADPERLPGVMAVYGEGRPLGFGTVTIEERDDPAGDGPREITVHARGTDLRLRMRLDVEQTLRRTLRRDPGGRAAGGRQFLQMRVRYEVEGEVAGRRLDFTAPGSAETFRGYGR